MSGSGQVTRTITPRIRPPHIQLIADQLQNMTRLIVMAVNARFFDISNPLTADFIDPLFSAPPMPPQDPAPLGIEGWRDYMTTITTRFTEYRVKILGLETEVNERVGTADVFMNFEVTGHPPGRHEAECRLHQVQEDR